MKKQAQRVVVVGAGVAGMAAARMLDRHGLEVHLIEKSDHLGGHAVRWACMATQECNQCGACLSLEMVDQINHSPGIQVHLNSEPATIVREEDGCRVTIEGAARQELSAQGVIWATGMTPFIPTALESLQYGRHPRIITTADLNHRLQSGTLMDLLGKTQHPSIAFFQCVGSRNKQLGNDYCSQVCCKVALRQADKLHQLLPESELTICHIDLQWMGKQLRAQARRLAEHIELLQGVPGDIRIDPQTDRLITVHEDPASGDRIARSFDLIVLSVGMRPADGIQSLLGPLDVPCDDWGFISGKAPLPPRVHAAGAATFPTDIVGARQQGVNAAYRLLEELEQLPATNQMTAQSRVVAVFGDGPEGRSVAQSIRTAGYTTVLLDAASGSDDGSENFERLPGAQITAISKKDDLFSITAMADGNKHTFQAGAIVIATGVRHCPIACDEPVVSLSELETAQAADLERIPQRVVFWLDHSGPEHKANCRRALEAAVDLTASGRQVTVILEKVLVHGPDGQRLYDRARGQGVRILRAADASAVAVRRSGEGLCVELKEATLADMELSIPCDLVVASDQVLPTDQTPAISRLIAEPLDQLGFLQWANVRHQPINSRKRTIFYVGGCHDEKDAADLDGEITTLLAELAGLAAAGDETVVTAEINPGQCARCLACFRSCPHGAVQLRQTYQPQIQSEDCIGCGRCVSLCPARAIHMGEVASEKELAAETVMFACNRSGHLAAERAQADGLIPSDRKLSIIPVACCNSRIGMSELIKPLLKGAGRVIVAACHPGNCRSMESGGQAARQIQDMAPAMGLSPDAIRWDTIAANEHQKVRQVLENQSTSSSMQKGVN